MGLGSWAVNVAVVEGAVNTMVLRVVRSTNSVKPAQIQVAAKSAYSPKELIILWKF